MAIRTNGRKLSFEILSRSSSLEEDTLPSIPRSSSDLISGNCGLESTKENGKRRRNRGSKNKKKNKATKVETILENGDSHLTIVNGSVEDLSWDTCDFGNSEIGGERKLFEKRLNYFGGDGCVVTQTIHHNGFNFGELRQRNVNGSFDESNDERFCDTVTSDKKLNSEEMSAELSSSENPPFEDVQNQFPRSENKWNSVKRLDTEASLDWKQLMADDPDFISAETRSPMKYLMEEINGGISLRSTTTCGNDIERERIYDTIFRLPWRCEVVKLPLPFSHRMK